MKNENSSVQSSESETPVELNAINLKAALWDTLKQVRAGTMTPGSADAVASQAREILRTVRTQCTIFSQASQSVSSELIDFAKPKE